jgi:hypothetical protein
MVITWLGLAAADAVAATPVPALVLTADLGPARAAIGSAGGGGIASIALYCGVLI